MENNIKPNSYSKTDKAENEAILLFKTVINNDFVKTDIKERDKYPNVDGTIELVDTEIRPIGKFDVQIRKIPQNSIKYSCPTSLVEYGKVSTLPILLICCDVENKIAYWKHIRVSMPEYKEDQESFTIKFNEMDRIDDNEIYINRWKGILVDYKQRISDFPKLESKCIELVNALDNNISLSKITKKDKTYFQDYIDTINTLLDKDIACIKELFFPDIWKLGVGIHECSEERMAYMLYKIEKGETLPLITAVDIDPLKLLKNRESNAFSAHFMYRRCTSDAIKNATEFIGDYLKEAFTKRLFAVHGTYLSIETLFSFLNQYHKIFGLEESLKYKMADIEKGYYVFFPKACTAYVYGVRDFVSEIHIDVEQLNYFCTTHHSFLPWKINNNVRWVFSSRRHLLRNIRDSIEYLNSNSIHEIEYPLRPTDFRDTLSTPWIWSGYERPTEIHNVSTVLKASLHEYETFVKGNRLVLANSPYLDRKTAIVFYYKPTSGKDFQQGPALTEYHFDNEDNVLPKLTVITDKQSHVKFGETLKHLNKRQISFSGELVSFLFLKMPFTNMIYNMLGKDLERHYKLHLPKIEV
jgi:hypothetical protein